MKVRIEIDDSLNEDEIVIRIKEYTEELQQLISNFKSKPSIQFFKTRYRVLSRFRCNSIL